MDIYSEKKAMKDLNSLYAEAVYGKPKSVRTSLTDAQKRATNRKKKEASKKGSQYAKYSKSIAKKVRMA